MVNSRRPVLRIDTSPLPPQINWTSSPLGYLVVVLFLPVIIAWFYVMERRAKRSVARHDKPPVDANRLKT